MSLLTKEQVLASEKDKHYLFVLNSLKDYLFYDNGIDDINLHPVLYFLKRVLSEKEDPLSIKYKDLEKMLETDIDDSAMLELSHLEYGEEGNTEIWDKTLRSVYEAVSKGEITVDELGLFSVGFSGTSNFSGYYKTPKSILNLANKVLNIQNKEKVADIGCGNGAFLIEAWKSEDKAYYYGCEKEPPYANCSNIRTSFLKGNFEIQFEDAFNLPKDVSKRFDKIFSNYPFKVPVRNLQEGKDYLESLEARIPSISKGTSSDWIYNALLCDLLTENGKAVGIMTNGSTWNNTDKAIRQYFIENGLVEAIISLPAKLFDETSIPTSMIIMSKGNKSVKLVDATDLFEAERRVNKLSETNIEEILKALKKDGEHSLTVSKEKLRDNDYSLNYDRYIVQARKTFKNQATFESVIRSITRGAAIKADELDRISTKEVTNKNYLMLGNIHDGIIDEELPYLSNIDANLERYCLKKNNLILSKNGFPFKVAVANPKEGQQILANGNLYIIEVDEEKANPYYLKAFFESEQGIASLKSIVVGATIKNIGVEGLKNLNIPVPPLEDQNSIAEKYQATQDEIKVYKMRLAKAVDRLYHIFDEGEEC